MNRLVRAAMATVSMASALAVANGPAAVADPGCGGLCSVDGGFSVTAQRQSPCSNFGGNVCYILSWRATVRGSSLVAGAYTATTIPNYGAPYAAGCNFVSPATTNCSGSGGTWIDIVPPNSTTCHSWSSSMSNGVSTVATDSGSSCRSVGT